MVRDFLLGLRCCRYRLSVGTLIAFFMGHGTSLVGILKARSITSPLAMSGSSSLAPT